MSQRFQKATRLIFALIATSSMTAINPNSGVCKISIASPQLVPISLTSEYYISDHHIKPWIFGADPFPIIGKTGTVHEENVLFFVSDNTCAIDVILWLKAPGRTPPKIQPQAFANLDFNVIIRGESYNLTNRVKLDNALAGDINASEASSRTFSVHLGSMDDPSLISDWLTHGMTGLEIIAKNDATFRLVREYWDIEGLSQAVNDLTRWCASRDT